MFSNKRLRENFFKIFREVFASFSQVFASFLRFSELLGPARTCSDAFGWVWMRLDAFGSTRTRSENFRKNPSKNQFFGLLVRFLRSYAKTDVTGRFLAIFRSGYTYLELDTTLGAHLGIVCRPGMASASPIGRLQSHFLGGGGAR